MKWRSSITISIIMVFTLALCGCSALEDVGDLASDIIDAGIELISEAFDSGGPRTTQTPAPNSGDPNSSPRSEQQDNNSKPRQPNSAAIADSSSSARSSSARSSSARSSSASARSGQAQLYACVDPATKLTVSTLRLPAGWHCASSVMHPAGSHSFWRHALVNTQNGGVGIINSGIILHALGPSKNQKILADPNSFAGILGRDLQRAYSQVKDFKITSCALKASAEPTTLQLADMFTKQSGLKYTPLTLEARYSFNGNGQVLKGGSQAELVVNDLNMSGLQASNITIVNSWCWASSSNEFANHHKTIKQIMASDNVTPEWQQYLAQENMQLSAQIQQNATQLQNTLDETSRIISSGYAERSAAHDRISQGWSEAILGTESINDPFDSSHQIEVSAYNDHAWVNASGDVINTDSSLYNPNTDSAINNNEWRQLK